MLAGRQRQDGHIGMGDGGGGESHRVDVRRCEDLAEGSHRDAELGAHPGSRFRIVVGDRSQRSQLEEVARKVPAPVAAANLGDPYLARHALTTLPLAGMSRKAPRVSTISEACSAIMP
jgi:hypothetical protein